MTLFRPRRAKLLRRGRAVVDRAEARITLVNRFTVVTRFRADGALVLVVDVAARLRPFAIRTLVATDTVRAQRRSSHQTVASTFIVEAVAPANITDAVVPGFPVPCNNTGVVQSNVVLFAEASLGIPAFSLLLLRRSVIGHLAADVRGARLGGTRWRALPREISRCNEHGRARSL